MLVLGDDILPCRVGVDPIGRPCLPAVLQRGLLIGIADGNVPRSATAADRCFDRLFYIIELVFAASARIVGCLPLASAPE